MRSLRLAVTGAVIETKAESLRKKHDVSADEFKVSRGCVLRFCRRTGTGNPVRFWCEAGSVDK